MAADCRYCGNGYTVGGYCPGNPPSHRHVLTEQSRQEMGEDTCVYCGQTFTYGGYCVNNPPSHRHAKGAG